MLSYMSKYKQKFGYKVKGWLHRLYGATMQLHLINYLESLVAPNSLLNGATLSPGWLQIAYPQKVQFISIVDFIGNTKQLKNLLQYTSIFYNIFQKTSVFFTFINIKKSTPRPFKKYYSLPGQCFNQVSISWKIMTPEKRLTKNKTIMIIPIS